MSSRSGRYEQKGKQEQPEQEQQQPTARDYDIGTEEIRRPGISPEFLRAQKIRHVDVEEAESLLGFRPSSGGIWIPYPGLNSTEMVVNGRKFGRLRLDKPSGSTKYLSPKNSGAHVYVPPGGPPFGLTTRNRRGRVQNDKSSGSRNLHRRHRGNH